MTLLPFNTLESTTTSGLALQLFDGYTGYQQLQCDVTVTIPSYNKIPLEKTDTSTFLFFDLKPGQYTISVQPDNQTPYYAPVSIPITLPMSDPNWQAYPDLSLANKNLDLNDPTQPAAYRAQHVLATLQPTAHYPFPPDASLVRGTVLFGANPLAGATVLRIGDNTGAKTDINGEFVLFFDDWSAIPQSETIRAIHPTLPNSADVQITVQRGTTVSTKIVMTP